jgi:hypothetical protein
MASGPPNRYPGDLHHHRCRPAAWRPRHPLPLQVRRMAKSGRACPNPDNPARQRSSYRPTCPPRVGVQARCPSQTGSLPFRTVRPFTGSSYGGGTPRTKSRISIINIASCCQIMCYINLTRPVAIDLGYSFPTEKRNIPRNRSNSLKNKRVKTTQREKVSYSK